MDMDMATHLQAVYNTLCELEVRGHANVKRMALCLDYLEELRDQVMKGETNDAAVAGEDEKEVADQLDLCDDGDGAGRNLDRPAV